jgi:sulfur carrier protein ThiS
VERRRQDLNLQGQGPTVFETVAIPGYATSASSPAAGGEAAKCRGYLGVFVPVVRVQFRPRRQEERLVPLPDGATVADVLREVGQPASSTLVVRGQDPVGESEPVRDGETLLLVSSFSGG